MLELDSFSDTSPTRSPLRSLGLRGSQWSEHGHNTLDQLFWEGRFQTRKSVYKAECRWCTCVLTESPNWVQGQHIHPCGRREGGWLRCQWAGARGLVDEVMRSVWWWGRWEDCGTRQASKPLALGDFSKRDISNTPIRALSFSVGWFDHGGDSAWEEGSVIRTRGSPRCRSR